MLIMISMILILVGIFTMIYTTSYSSIYNSCQNMLKKYCESFITPGDSGPKKIESDKNGSSPSDAPFDKNSPDVPEPEIDRPPESSRAFKANSFCSVLYKKDGTVDIIDNLDDIYTDEEIVEYSKDVLESGTSEGKISPFIYRVEKVNGGAMIAFVDATIFENNNAVLIKYTFIFGFAAVLLVFIAAVLLSKRIIAPLIEYDNKQRQFVSDAGHELKTPVSVISTNSDMLKKEIGENRWLDNIVYENSKMGRLVKELMQLTSANSPGKKMSETDLSRIVKGEALAFDSVAYEKGLTLDYSGIEDDIIVKGNANQLTELCTILLDNAISYGNNDTDIVITLRKTSSKAFLSVSNSADNIDSDKISHIFDRFYRTDESRADSGHYGLGLSIAKAVAKAHRGDISVKYQSGIITFNVYIPLK